MTLPFASDHLRNLRDDLAARSRQLLINGEFADAASGETFDVVDPSTGTVFATVAKGGREDIDRAVAAARDAFDKWAATAPAERARLLLRLADLIEAEGERIALTETLDNGMPFMLAKFAGVGGAAEALRYNAGWATKLTGETMQISWPGE